MLLVFAAVYSFWHLLGHPPQFDLESTTVHNLTVKFVVTHYFAGTFKNRDTDRQTPRDNPLLVIVRSNQGLSHPLWGIDRFRHRADYRAGGNMFGTIISELTRIYSEETNAQCQLHDLHPRRHLDR